MHRHLSEYILISFFVFCLLIAAPLFLLQQQVRPAQENGALISVEMQSTVGVLLDELPPSMRDTLKEELTQKPINYWEERAKQQLRLTTYRLIFREYFAEGKKSLPLPPEDLWNIQLLNSPELRVINNHEVVAVDYRFTSTILTDKASPGVSEPRLETVGGLWKEPFIFPVDPVLVFQRTGFACLDEAEFPQRSVDPEDLSVFYDQECSVESTTSQTGCHLTKLPELSCIDALEKYIGKVETSMTFKRLPWNTRLANAVRSGPITNALGPDLQVVQRPEYRINYRYIEKNSCAITEECVGGSGWRRLVQFPAGDWNTGAKPLTIGQVDYFLDGADSPLADHHIYEFSECHEHYHFSHYANFLFGNNQVINSKKGFCLQSTARFSNNEQTPLHNPFGGCEFQGVEAGWGDEYSTGLECQWVDITNVALSSPPPVSAPLKIELNPDEFLCEGTPTVDSLGNQLFAPSPYKTNEGKTVDQPLCQQGQDIFANNVFAMDVQVPVPSEGFVTSPCKNGEIGPKRNCGFTLAQEKMRCRPGSRVKLTCSLPAGSAPHVARVCDYSSALQTAIPCSYNGPHNAQALANAILETRTELSVECPTTRDVTEPGGIFSIYAAPLNTSEQTATVTCTFSVGSAD